ncbi:MAG: NAD(P)H-dependent oxidoreductase [Croceitalea sp.]|nr:NAD(P)H-dependent oxidoreductase [Croceitalea sp.]NNL08546.1 NAD(P)H-dependent oxidoreductase [Croceitalea sp.]
MAKILAFAGSNSSTSINFKLVKYTISTIRNHDIQVMDMSKYTLPMFSVDLEKESGYANALVELKDDIQQADGLILSVNEHNGNPSAFFKNVLDWLSRVELKFLDNTKILLMSTSPGRRGASSSMEIINNSLPRFGGEVVATFSLPSFNHTFEKKKGIIEEELAKEHQQAVNSFLAAL